MRKILLRLLSFLTREIKVDKEAVHKIVDDCDMDADGCISIAELVDMARRIWEARK